MTLYTQVESNRRKTIFYMLLFSALILLLGYVISYAMDSSFILVIAAVITIVQGFVSIRYSDSIALIATGAREMDLNSEAGKRVKRIVENLCITAGLKMPALYVLPDSSMNAFATGRDTEHSAVAVTVGLLESLDDNELAGVIAHELSHVGNEDIKLMGMVMIMAGLVTLIADLFLRNLFWAGDSEDSKSSGVMLLVAIVLSILAPIAATLIQLAISRKREFMADADAVLLTRYPEGLISALRKISGDVAPAKANRAVAHMYFSNPLKGGFASLFSTHPPIEERIAALEAGSGMNRA